MDSSDGGVREGCVAGTVLLTGEHLFGAAKLLRSLFRFPTGVVIVAV